MFLGFFVVRLAVLSYFFLLALAFFCFSNLGTLSALPSAPPTTHSALGLHFKFKVHRISKVHVRSASYKALCKMCFIKMNFSMFIHQFSLSSIISIIIISNIYNSCVHRYLVNIKEEKHKPQHT